MLRRLSIRNYVLISSLDIDLGAGMAVFTGETGAGKSILLDALGLALGARATSGVVARGSDRAGIVAVFDIARADPVRDLLAEHDLDHGGELLLRRVVGADGRSRAFVNDTQTGIALLRRIGGLLVEIDGQTEAGGLLDPAGHLAMLDDFAGQGPERESLAAAHAAWRAARAAQEEAEAAQEASRREEDYLRHAVAELEALAPESGEEARRAAERAMLLNGQNIAEVLDAASTEIAADGGVGARIRTARRAIERAAPAAGGALDALLATLERAAIEAEEAEGALSAALRTLDTDPGRLEAVEERLFALRAAARKHRTGPDSLVPLLSKLQGELDLIEGGADRLAGLQAATEAARQDYRGKAQAVSRARRRAARALDEAVAAELAPLKLARAHFSTAIDPAAEGAETRTGIDRCRFMLAPDPGVDPLPLAKIASGGERARPPARAPGVSRAGQPVCRPSSSTRSTAASAAPSPTPSANAWRGSQATFRSWWLPIPPRSRHAATVTTESPEAKGRSDAAAQVALLTDDQRQEEIARMLSGARVTEEARAAAGSLLARSPS